MSGLWLKLKHSVSKPFVLAAFRLRERRRRNRNFPVRWLTASRIVSDDFADHVDVEGLEALGSEFVQQMVVARDSAMSSVKGFSTVSLTISVYFLLSVLAIDLPIPLFGVELKNVAGLNELLLIASSSASAIGMLQMARGSMLNAGIKAAIVATKSGPLVYFYRLAFLPQDYVDLYRPLYKPYLVWGRLKVWVAMSTAMLALVFIFSVLALSLGVRVSAAWSVLTEPTTTNALLRAFVWAAPVIDLAASIFAALYVLPWPHRDYFNDHKYTALADRFPEDALQFAREMYSEGWADEDDLRKRGYLSRRS